MEKGYKQTEIGLIPEDWKIDRIKKLAVITTGSRNTQDRIETGQYPFFVRSQKIERINTYSFDGEAVLTAGDGVGIGKVFHYMKGKFDFHQRVYKISDFNEELYGFFFYLYFSNAFLKRIMSMTAKSSVDSVRMEMIADMLVPLPPKNEQIAIAKAVFDITTLTESLHELIEKKKSVKQGAVQELLTGRKRLPGFSGRWIQEELSKICWFQEGPGLRNWQFTNDGMKVINVTNLENGYLNLESTERHISLKEFYTRYRHFEIDEGDIVVASSGNSYGKVSLVRKQDLPLLMNTSVIRFKPLKGLDHIFLLQFLKSPLFKRQIDLLITGGAQPNFGPVHLKKITLLSPPTEEEQSVVAQVLYDMDSEIEALEQKRGKYKQLKVGMMQQLLTGRIRLKCMD